MQGMKPENKCRETLQKLYQLREKSAFTEPAEALALLNRFLIEHHQTLQDCPNNTLRPLVDELGSLAEALIHRLRLSFKQSSVPLSARARKQLFVLLDSLNVSEQLFKLEFRLAGTHERYSKGGAEFNEARILSVHERLNCKQEHLLALHHARVRAVSLLILDCFQAYVPVPERLYQHLHKVARQAREYLFHKHHQGWVSVRASYLAILMLAMVNPYALRCEDMEEMLDCLRHLSGYVRLRSEPTESMGRYLDISGRIAPHVAISKGYTAGKRIFVDVEELFSDKARNDIDKGCQHQLDRFLARLQLFIIPRKTRKKIKSDQEQDQKPWVWVTAGFYSAHQQLLQQATASGDKINTRLALSGIDWLGTEDSPARKHNSTAAKKHKPLELNLDRTKPAEDLNYEGIPKGDRTPKVSFNRPRRWELIDVSDGGLRVRWPEKGKCRIQVGDVMFIESEGASAQKIDTFYVAVARWLRHVNEQLDVVDVGVEQFSGQWSAFFAYPEGARMGQAESWPVFISSTNGKFDYIILPTQESLRGQVLRVVDHDGVEQRIELGKPIEQDVSYQLMEVACG
ncbi:MAG TPA: hypothetical protein ENM98_01705 [Halothiobacillaceae bacterium]|nr:hypothetical protein [Halothiobacillaceae bacterium]